MSVFCPSCGAQAGEGNFCTSCGSQLSGGHAPAAAPAGFQPPPPPAPAGWAPAPAYGQAPFKKSLGGAIVLLVFAILGVINPFLPYISYYGEAVNGWDSVDAFKYYGEFSNGPLISLIGSAIALVVALVIIIAQNGGKKSNKAALGVITLVVGLVVLGSAGASFNAWDAILEYEGEAADQGIGLFFAAASGLAQLILGIVILASPRVTQGRN